MKYYLPLLAMLWATTSSGQFTNLASQYNFTFEGSTTQSGCGVSFYDYDKDGWDDLTVGQTNHDIIVYHNNNGIYELAYTFPNTGDPKQLCWVDYDNDGDADFFFAVSTQSCKLFRNDGAMVFTEVTAALNQPITNGKSFGACWGDYDNDSFLDVYICNYSQGPNPHTNWLLHNNGDGTFENVTTLHNVGNGIRPSYQCTWIDINQDGWLDLYVTNDFSYINELYINDGTTFTAAGADWGLDIAMEGMGIAWSDFDFDGDYDVFLSDNLPGNKLMRNDGDTMVDIAASAGVLVNSTCWGSLWIDYDHDGLDDLHVSTSNVAINSNQNYLFHNNGDYTFSDSSMATDKQVVFASAKGDIDNDGYWDFVEMKQYPSTLGLWQNDGGTNHWLKLGFEGTVSNRDGIGAVVHYSHSGNQYMLHTFCGEGFLDQDSQYEILSLGENTMLDSLSIKWPSGWIDRYYNLTADQFYPFVEGATFQASVENISGHELCPQSDPVILSATPGNTYSWTSMWFNEPVYTQEVEAYFPGTYTVVITNEFGISTTESIEVTMYNLPTIVATPTQPLCFGDSNGCISIEAIGATLESVVWEGEEDEAMHCDLTSGFYTAAITDNNGCTQVLSYTLDQPDSLWVTFSSDTACYGGTTSADVAVMGGTGFYTYDWDGADPEALAAGEYTVSVKDNHLCEATATWSVPEFNEIFFTYTPDTVCSGSTIDLQYEVSGGEPEYDLDWNGVNPEALGSGNHTVMITDANDCSLNAVVHVDVSPGMVIDADITNAQDGNNGAVTVSVAGGIPPYTYVWEDDTTGPTLTNIGQGVYTVVVTDTAGCEESLDVEIIDINVDEIEQIILVSPNPCIERLQVQLAAPSAIVIHDAYGKLVFMSSQVGSYYVVDTSSWGKGVYILAVGDRRSVIVRN